MSENLEVKEESVVKTPVKQIPRSYGMLVFRLTEDRRTNAKELEYLIARPSGGKGQVPYYLPKGGKNEGETAEQAAYREVEEETGLRAKIVAPLGTIRYRNGRKEIELFLGQYTGGTVLSDGSCPAHTRDWENDDVRFVDYFTAMRLLRMEFKEVLVKANKMLRG